FSALDVEGEYVFAAKRQGGLTAYHAFLPGGLRSAGTKGGPWTAEDLQVVGERIYMADSRSGLRVFQARSGIPQGLLGDLPVFLASGTVIDLPERSAAGLPIQYTVVEGDAVIDGRVLRITGPGNLTIRAEVEGDAQFLPAVVQRTVYAVEPPVVVMESVEAGLRFRWVPNFGTDTLVVTDSLNEPANWQPAEILFTEYSEAEMILTVTVPLPNGTRFYRVLRQ
ncbi:MAG TPA: hypothetical protein PLX89_07460, partial [Verrucomicrobiota bacterium]|nr:hypothetical protein [Verrucomicrobiales bacterium]HRI12827.1 hypothetical protein [Verrucomicrobiota bacterium]